MKTTVLIIISLALAAFLIWPGSALSSPESGLDGALEKLIGSSCARESRPGVGVLSLKDDSIILEMNLHKPHTPASNVKIFTSLTALKKLKHDYTFKTIFYVDGEIDGGVLHGNLYIKGFGNPDLVPEQVWRMASDLRSSGIHTVEGDLVADSSYFDGKLRGPGWNTRWSSRAYHAPINALSVNFNTVTVRILPGAKQGEKADVYVHPKSRYIKLNNLAVTGPPGTRTKVKVSRKSVPGGDQVSVTGRISQNSKGRRYLLNITKPTLFALTVFDEMLKKEGLVITGDLRIDTTPPHATEHMVHQSRPLGLIVWGLNKFSSNFVAEQILKTMGAEIKGEPGTFAKGIQVIQEQLEEIGIRPDSYGLVDGSGLSTRNRISPAQLIQVLQAAYRDFKLNPEFISSLAVMGVDGSVSDRLKDSLVTRNVRAKTGNLYGVSTLSGYAHVPDTGPVAFSIMINGSRCDYYQAKDLQDKILLLLYNNSSNSSKP